MGTIHEQKREAYRKRVMSLLTEIFNDSAVMPNADCADLVVSVVDVWFGPTVKTIYVDVFGHWKSPSIASGAHERYMEEAKQNGRETYSDLTDVVHFPNLLAVVAKELQRRLDLPYCPDLRHPSRP